MFFRLNGGFTFARVFPFVLDGFMNFAAYRSQLLTAVIVLTSMLVAEGAVARQVYNIPVTTSPGDQRKPVSVTAGEAEGVFIFWVSGGGSSGQLQMQSLDAVGRPTRPAPIRIAGDASTSTPLIALQDGSKGAFIIWEAVGSRGNAIKVQRIAADGSPVWSAPKSLYKNNRTQKNPRAASDGRGGLYIAWEEESVLSSGNGGNRDIYAQRLDASGNIEWDAGGVEIVVADDNQYLGDVAGNSTALVVAWEDAATDKVYFQPFTAGKGDPIGSNPRVPTFSPSAMRSPRLVMGIKQSGASDNSVIIVWQEKRTAGIKLYAQKYTADRPYAWGIFGEAVSGSTGDQVNHQVVSDHDFGCVIVWEDNRDGNTDLYGQRIDSAGNPQWGATGRPVNTKGSEQTGFHLIADGNQGVFCVWEDNRNGAFDVFAQNLNKNGRMRWRSGGVGISKQEDHQVSPRTALLADGRLAVVWEDYRSGSADIFAQNVLEDGTLDNVPPDITSQPVLFAGSGLPYSYQVTAEDIDQDLPISFALEEGPDWLEISDTGLVSGTPPIGSEGSVVRVTVLAIDARQGTGSQTYDLTIQTGNNPPVITSTPDTTVLEDATYSYTVTFSDEDVDDTHSISAPVLPGWLRLEADAFVLTGTPDNADVGRHEVVVRVTDQLGAFAEQQFFIEVINTNDPPVIVSEPPKEAREDALFQFVFEAEDVDAGDILTFSLPVAPNWLVISESTGELTGTPVNDDVGIDTVRVRVSDSAGASDSLQFLLEVVNVNDPPEFVSSPKTTAFPGVRYAYKVVAIDIDPDDEPTVSLGFGPTWLSFLRQDSLLTGIPPLSLKGDSVKVQLLATDRQGAETEQLFMLTISEIADTTAPAAPMAVSAEPSAWSNADSVLLRWVNPPDSSSLTVLFVKFHQAPSSETDFDQRVELESQPGEADSARIFIPEEISGRVPVFFWLGDAAGNADFNSATPVEIAIDRSAPQPAVALSPLLWSRSDIVTFRFSPAQDTLSGIAGYRIAVIAASVGEERYDAEVTQVAQNVLETTLALSLGTQDKNYDWYVIALDSAGNEASGSPVSGVGVDDVRPAIAHTPPDSITMGQAVTLAAEVIDDGSGVDTVFVLYRSPSETAFRKLGMARRAASLFEVTIPAGTINPSGFEYTIAARDLAGNEQLLRGQQSRPVYKSVPVISTDVSAPQTLRNEYQLIAVPFSMKSRTIKTFFESNFGEYDNTQWRLLYYDPAVQQDDYIEFEQFSERSLQPGMAFWLITRDRKGWKTGTVQSVPSDEPYVISVRPGWNMIASPFAFSIDTSMVQFPQPDEAVLWEYGADLNYRIATKLEAWKGYFYFNSAPSDRQLIIDPSQRVTLPAAKAVHMEQSMEWQGTLSVSLNGRSDVANYFGVGEQAFISEPPAIGSNPRVYFFHRESGRELALLYGENLQQWQCVVENLSPGVLKFTLDLQGELPAGQVVAIRDERTGTTVSLNPGEAWSVLVSEGESSRTFQLSLVDADELSGQDGVPASMELFPVYPNPFSLSREARVTIRFALAQQARVELRIYNLLGQEVWRSHFSEPLPAGLHALSWNGQTLSGERPAAGVYLLRLIADGKSVAHQKIMLVR